MVSKSAVAHLSAQEVKQPIHVVAVSTIVTEASISSPTITSTCEMFTKSSLLFRSVPVTLEAERAEVHKDLVQARVRVA